MPYSIRISLRLVGVGLVAAMTAWTLTVATAPAPTRAQTKGGGPWAVTNTPFASSIAFSSCSGFGSSSEIIQNTSDTKLGFTSSPGRTHHYPVSCDRAYTATMELYNWRQLVIAGDPNHERDVAFIYRDPYTGQVQEWRATRAWPSDYFAAFDREIVTFYYDSLTRVK